MKFDPSIEGFAETTVQSFLADKTLLEVRSHFFLESGKTWLGLMLTYDENQHSLVNGEKPKEQKLDEAVKVPLDEPGKVLLATLRSWRSDTARRDGVPAYLIATNRMLAEVAALRPGTLAALREINGFGEAKVARYGHELVGLVSPQVECDAASSEVPGQ